MSKIPPLTSGTSPANSSHHANAAQQSKKPAEPKRRDQRIADIHVTYRDELQSLAIEAIEEVEKSEDRLLSDVTIAKIIDFLATKDRECKVVTLAKNQTDIPLLCHLFIVQHSKGSLEEYAAHNNALKAQLRNAHKTALKMKKAQSSPDR